MSFSDDTKKVVIQKSSDDIIGPPPERKILTKQEIDASKMAQTIIEEAKKKAEEIIGEKEKIVEEAKNEAYNEGYKSGLESINKILLELKDLRNNTIVAMESEIVKLAFRIARKILGYEMQRDDTTVLSIVKEVLKASRHQKSIKLSVNPDDYKIIKQNRESLVAVLTKCESFLIEPNEHISKGGCEIETEIGNVSANLDTQLEVLESLLLNKEV